jgi:hypothetical protein
MLNVFFVAASDVAPCGDAAASAFCSGPKSGFEPGIAYPHASTLPGPTTANEAECCCACANTHNCNGWTSHPPHGACYLKTNAGPDTAVKSTAVSGLMPPPPPYKPPYPTPAGAKSVLFLAVDDMRPSLGAYNFTLPGQPTHSPNIDRLAAEGTLFTRAYVQYSYCSPSRNSFMTGRRPDTTKVWEFVDHFREVGVGSDWTSMPQYFKQFGYLVLGAGKLYHPSSDKENIGMDFMDYPASWSPDHPYYFPKDSTEGLNCSSQGPDPAPPHSPGHNFVWCSLDLPKEASVLFDQKVRDQCVRNLESAANMSKEASRPFFIGCGFHKPHAPYYAPREFYDRLPAHQYVPLPLDPFAPVGMPEVAWHPQPQRESNPQSPGPARSACRPGD